MFCVKNLINLTVILKFVIGQVPSMLQLLGTKFATTTSKVKPIKKK